MDDDYDDFDDELYVLGDVVPKRVHKVALRIYLDASKNGDRIPPPLQDYINRGLQRFLDGARTPFKTTQTDKHNQQQISLYVTALTKKYERKISKRKKGKARVQAIKEARVQAVKDVAATHEVDEKTIEKSCKKYADESPEYALYYLLEAMSPNDVD